MPKAPSCNETTRKFGARLQERRIEKGLEMQQIGKLIGIKHSSISKYESGVQGPSVDMLFKLSEILDCSVDYLLGRVNLPNMILLKGEQIPKELRDKSVDAVEVLRSQVTEDGGITPAAQREALKILSEAKLLKYSKPRQPKPDPPDSSIKPPD
jgi:transcriptional regulator with XRE-family HTH domain